MSQILYPINHPGHTRQQKCRSDRISDQRTPASILKTNFKMAASVPFHVLEEVTHIDREELQDSSDEKSENTDEAIESPVNCFTECTDLEVNFAFFLLNKRQKDI